MISAAVIEYFCEG